MSGEEKNYSEQITTLGDSIAQLTLLDAADLASYLEDKLGVSAAAMMAAPAAAPAAAEGDAGGADDKNEFNLIGVDFDAGGDKVKAIKYLRVTNKCGEHVGATRDIGVSDAKKMIENPADQILFENVPKEKVKEITDECAKYGLKVKAS